MKCGKISHLAVLLFSLFANSVFAQDDDLLLKEAKLGDRILTVDDSGTDVNALVRLLSTAKFLSKKDSKTSCYDTHVKKAVKNFQRMANITPTGDLDQETLKKMKTYLSDKDAFIKYWKETAEPFQKEPKMYSCDPIVRPTAHLLSLYGFLVPYKISNMNNTETLYDKNVKKALTRFQKKAGLTPTGKIDQSTYQQILKYDPE